MKKRSLALAVIALTSLVPPHTARAAAPEADEAAVPGSGGSFHLRVEGGRGDTNLNLNLPLAAVDWALAALADEHVRGGHIRFESQDVNVATLRKAWNELKRAGGRNFVEMEDRGERLFLRIEGDRLLLEITSRKKDAESISIRVPTAAVDALLGGTGEGLDLRAALARMRDGARTELLEIRDGDTRIHAWID